MLSLRTLFLLMPCLLFSAAFAHAQLELSDHRPRVGQQVTITLPAAADTIQVRYRPNSAIPVDEFLVVPADARQVTWVPGQPGVASLRMNGGAWQNVSVRFEHYLVSGILVMILAGTILFGGIGYALNKMFSERVPSSDAPPTI